MNGIGIKKYRDGNDTVVIFENMNITDDMLAQAFLTALGKLSNLGDANVEPIERESKTVKKEKAENAQTQTQTNAQMNAQTQTPVAEPAHQEEEEYIPDDYSDNMSGSLYFDGGEDRPLPEAIPEEIPMFEDMESTSTVETSATNTSATTSEETSTPASANTPAETEVETVAEQNVSAPAAEEQSPLVMEDWTQMGGLTPAAVYEMYQNGTAGQQMAIFTQMLKVVWDARCNEELQRAIRDESFKWLAKQFAATDPDAYANKLTDTQIQSFYARYAAMMTTLLQNALAKKYQKESMTALSMSPEGRLGVIDILKYIKSFND